MQTNNRLFLDIHIIQTVPPSNLNRDDTGSPKTAQYGGVRRARVSSQAWKKAMRDFFAEKGAKENVGVRTLNVADYVKDKIIEIDNQIDEDEAIKMAVKVLKAANVKLKENKTKALFFIGEKQATALAKAAITKVEDKKELQKLLLDNPSIDIALFGRMVADDPSLNEDASSQVAHAISTHAVQTEFDFFTAVDDKSQMDNAGAGMLGTIEYNSSTLYRYANVAVHEFVRQLGDKESAINALKLYVKAFSNSMPTGKANTFANQTLPQLVLVELREDRPVNLVNAFENPVKSKDGYVKESINRIFSAEGHIAKFADKAVKSYYLVADDSMVNENSEKVDSIDLLLEKLGGKLEELLKK